MSRVATIAFAFYFMSQGPALRIVVIAGEGAVNIIQQKTAVAPVVEVRDRNNLPVPGAVVTFSVAGGKAATFAGGLQTLAVTTNAAGQAVAVGLTPTVAGTIQINAAAVFQGQTAAALITQSNVMTAAQAAGAASTAGASGGGGGLSGGSIAGIAAGAAAAIAGAVVLTKEEAQAPPALATTTSPAGSGIRDVTVFTFTATGGQFSSPDFTWNFGDGATAAGNSVTHVFAGEGTFQVSVRARGSSGEETAATSVSVGSLTGTWTRPAVDGVSHRLVVTQQGPALTGQWFIDIAPGSPFGPSSVGPLIGTVSNPRGVRLEQATECRRLIANGTVNEDLRSMGGLGGYQNPDCGVLNAGSFLYTRQ
jgi:hypothetical protein